MKHWLFILSISLPLSTFCQRTLNYTRIDTIIKSVLVLAPVSEVFVINAGDRMDKDTLLSKALYKSMSKLLPEAFPDFVRKSYFTSDSITRSHLIRFIAQLNDNTRNNKQASRYKLSDSIARLFDTSKYHFVFCTYTGGFRRDINNIANQSLTGEIMKFLVGFGDKPIESALTVCCFIIDLKQKVILCFQRFTKNNIDPSNIEESNKSLNKIMRLIFFERKEK